MGPSPVGPAYLVRVIQLINLSGKTPSLKADTRVAYKTPMPRNMLELPPDLPVPEDDGAASHLTGTALPELSLPSTQGGTVLLQGLDRCVLFFYPRTGLPERPADAAWDLIPGARGCTPQSCGYRDLHGEFLALGARVFGVSTQTTEYQRAFAERNHIPFPILSDARLEVTRVMRLPTFEFDIDRRYAPGSGGGPNTLIKRMSWYVERGVIRKVWYPVFPPNTNAEQVLSLLRQAPALPSRTPHASGGPER